MSTPKTQAERDADDQRLLGSRGDTCPEGTHEMGRPIGRKTRMCKKCWRTSQTIYSYHCRTGKGAAIGDYRVVCEEPGCEYGRAVDADGHGYTNHTHIVLARASLLDHQSEHEEMHAASIQQHPIDAVIAADIERMQS